jgi:hypothetical protein
LFAAEISGSNKRLNSVKNGPVLFVQTKNNYNSFWSGSIFKDFFRIPNIQVVDTVCEIWLYGV